jgi:hypothetical protein
VPTRLDNVTENVIWAADGSEVDTVVARGRVLKLNGQLLPFMDDTRPEDVMAKVQALSEAFAEHQKAAPKLSGTGANR